MIEAHFVMLDNPGWSSETMLGFSLNDLRSEDGGGRPIFTEEFGNMISAEVISPDEMESRLPSRKRSCENSNNRSTICVPLHYRQKFIGFVSVIRLAETDEERDHSECIASILDIVGVLVADVSETRTNQKNERDILVAQNHRLQMRLTPVSASLVGESDAMREVYTQIRQVAATDATVLVRGPSGTGKELVARSLVELSNRKDRPFLTVNCAALPETLIESELFGHEKGAFTGAVERRIGRAEAADGGTLFLDEIGDLTPATQVKLLRFLQEKTFSRIGSNVELRSNVRFIAATSRNLEELIEKNLFREDLYYRLNIFTIQMPALADRRGDIPLLAQFFINKFNRKYGKNVSHLSPAFTAALIDWRWSGNVRELENCIERAILTSTDDVLRILNLPLPMRPAGWNTPPVNAPASPSLDPSQTYSEHVRAFRHSLLLDAISRANGNKSAAARSLGLSPRMMYYELRQTTPKKDSSNTRQLNG